MDRYGKISVWSRYSAQILFYNHPQIPGFMQLCSAVGRLDLLGGGGGGGNHERRSRKLLGGFPLKYLKYRVSDIAFSAFREHSFPALFK